MSQTHKHHNLQSKKQARVYFASIPIYIHWEYTQTSQLTAHALMQWSQHFQEWSNKLHLLFFIDCIKKRNMYKDWLDFVPLCEQERMIVDVVANKPTGVVWMYYFIAHVHQGLNNFIYRKRSLRCSKNANELRLIFVIHLNSLTDK